MFDQSKAGERQSQLANIIILVGVLLMIVGGVLSGPYLEPWIASRVRPVAVSTPSPPTPAPTLAPTSTPSPEPSPTASSSTSILPLFDGEEDGEGDATLPTPTPPATPPTATPTPTPLPTGRAPTRLSIPAIDLDVPVVLAELETTTVNGVSQSTWLVPEERAAGWHVGTAPLGLPGNTVLNGHNTTRGEVFRDLYLLEPGEQIILYGGEIPYVYEIQEKLILPEAGQPLEVRMANAQYIQPTTDERVTLVTCHPYNSLQYRLIIIATPVEVDLPNEENLE